MDTQARCPYCDNPLPKMPSRKSKCRACGQFMYVRSSPEDRSKRLVTEAQAAEIDAVWAEKNQKQKMWEGLSQVGLTPDDLEKATRLANGDRKEAYFALMDKTARRAAGKGDHQTAKTAYLAVAIYLSMQDEDNQKYAKLFHEQELLWIGKHARRARVISGHSCNNPYASKVYPIDELLRLQPLPCPVSSREKTGALCTCMYELVFDDEVSSSSASKPKRAAPRPAQTKKTQSKSNASALVVLLLLIVVIGAFLTVR